MLRLVLGVALCAVGAYGSFDFTVSTYPADTLAPIAHYIMTTQNGPDSSTRGVAAPFLVTDNLNGTPGETFQIENVMVALAYAGGVGSTEDIINLYIADDDAGVPGAPVTGGAVVTAGSGTAWNGAVFIDLASDIDVVEGETYWLVAEAVFDETHNNANNLFVWFPSASEAGTHANQTGDGSWNFAWTSSAVNPDNLPAFGINVPEPATAGLLVLAGVAVFAGRRRRRCA